MKTEKINEKEAWYLDKIEIEFVKGMDFRSDPKEKIDHYKGQIRFKNGHYESFSFCVDPDMCKDYIKLISKDIVKSANLLSERLAKSFEKQDLI